MAVFNAQQIKEINDLIEEIGQAIVPGCEIGAHDKAVLSALLRNQTPVKKAIYFKCRREFSEAIVGHFVKEKGVAKSRYHKNNQTAIYILK